MMLHLLPSALYLLCPFLPKVSFESTFCRVKELLGSTSEVRSPPLFVHKLIHSYIPEDLAQVEIAHIREPTKGRKRRYQEVSEGS
jgi:hypothetical protein